MKNLFIKSFGIIAILLMALSCATIPQEASELSSELGKRISAIEESHINLLHKFIDEKRKKVDAFIENEWTPNFSEEYFSQPEIANVWNQVVASGNKEDRLKLLVLVGPKLQKKINQERLRLIKPLDEIEKEIERKLRNEYLQAKSINNSLTSFLVSASKVAENRNRLLEMVGVESNKIKQVITDADNAVEELINSKESIEKRLAKFKITIEKVKKTFVNN